MLSRFRILLCFAIVFSCFPGFTQSPAGSTALVEGVVTNKVTGAPVRHAHVEYMKVAGKDASAMADTDGDGRFATTLEAGSYRFWVDHSGFAPQAYGSHTPDGTGT